MDFFLSLGWQPQSQFPKPSNNRLERCIALANAFRYGDKRYVTEYFYWDNVNCNKVNNFICETEKTTPTPTAGKSNNMLLYMKGPLS